MLRSRGPTRRPTPFGVIMYGRLIPSSTVISAQRTTGQRATSSSTPRHERRTPWGWNQGRDQHHIMLETSGTGRKWTKKSEIDTPTTGLCRRSATVGEAHRIASEI